MAKAKTHEEAMENVTNLQAEVKEHKAALTAYFKDNKLKRNDDHSDSKHGKKIAALEKKIERSREKLEKAKEAAKALKPKKERASKYNYPEGLTAEERKKYRAKMRAQEKKGEAPAKKKTSKKKTEKAPAKKKAVKKKSKKTSSKED